MFIDRNTDANQLWQQRSPQCHYDLRIKKILFTILCLINIAAIAGLLAYLTMNHTIPPLDGAYTLLPFVGGIIAAIVLLKIATFFDYHLKYRILSNVPLLLYEIVALLLVGPSKLTYLATDWTEYHDRREANQISHDLETKKFEESMYLWGPRIDKLEKYGYLTEDNASALKALYQKNREYVEEYHDTIADAKYKNKAPQLALAVITNLQSANNEWNLLKAQITLPKFNVPRLKRSFCDRLLSFFATSTRTERYQ